MNALEFNNVSKKFKKGEKFDSLRDMIPGIIRTFLKGNGSDKELRDKEFWAVKDVSFNVGKGEAMGIIGSNGAGKSTILKLISKILKPTSGDINIYGRLSALIEVGAGFHEDLTGRENVYLNGAILGMKKAEISKKFDEIVAFSELEEFIDTPVKRYSSGMYARLGFSVAAHLDPDILLVDEVLSVGDISFQSKCVEKIKKMKASGVTIVFISHNMEAMLGICDEAILLNRGQVTLRGSTADVVRQYRDAAMAKQRAQQTEKSDSPIQIKEVIFCDEAGKDKHSFNPGGTFGIRITVESKTRIESPVLGVAFYDGNGVCIYGHNSKIDKQAIGTISGTVTVDITYSNVSFQPGSYFVTVAIFDSLGMKPYDFHDKHYRFAIAGSVEDIGVIRIPHTWKINEYIDKG